MTRAGFYFDYRRVLAFAALIFLASALSAQTSLDSLNTKFSRYRLNHPVEKLFLHLDQTTHLCGETLWFKIYNVNGTTLLPMDFSKVAYVEIISESDEPVLQAKILLTNGVGQGSISLPITLSSGNYTLRAYTHWMKNEDAAFFFHQPITIINPFQAEEIKSVTISQPALDAQFFPEGGNLVDGIPTTVAFRVTDGKGKGVSFRGRVVDSNGDTLVRFSPNQFGIGAFELTPSVSGNYRAIIQDAFGIHTVAFPKVFDNGYTLRVTRERSDVRVQIRTRLSVPAEMVHVFIHTRNQIVYSESARLTNGEAVVSVSEQNLNAGVSHITVFDVNMNPVCERLIFKSPEKKMNITPEITPGSYQTREKVNLTLNILNERAESEPAEISIAVYKSDSLPSFSQQSIGTNLLMTSDLQGTIESPETYFEQNNPQALDQLMLTHGWRRFRWDDVLKHAGRPVKFQPEVIGHSVTGKIIPTSGSQVANIRLFLSAPSKNSLFFTTNTASDGTFRFIVQNVWGDRQIILQPDMTKDSLSTYTFRLDDPFAKQQSTDVHIPFTLSPTLEKTIVRRAMNLQVEDIFKKQQQPVFHVSDSSGFYGTADETYLLDDYTRFTVLEEVLREYVPGVVVKVKKRKFNIIVRDIVNHGVFSDEPLRLLDGVPIFDTDKLMQFDPQKIQKLEVISKVFFHGQSAFPGIVSFTTYHGDLAGFEPHPQSLALDFAGLQIQRDYYQPRYDTEGSKLSREPDSRTLLLWAPSVKVINGKAEIGFYTSDESGHFQIEVQCISSTGRMGSFESTFTIK